MNPDFIVMTIAGSDSGAGAGIQADLKTIFAFGGYGTCAITALTAQNTQGVKQVLPVSGEFLRCQLETLWEDLPAQAIKIGMLPHEESTLAVERFLQEHPEAPVVLDPVMVSTSGTRLLGESALNALQEKLFPKATLITPNRPEAEVLWGRTIGSREEAEAACRDISQIFGCSVLLKGGHFQEDASSSADFLWDRKNGKITCFSLPRILSQNSHGTGCTLSSAIACGLAKGFSLEKSVEQAKAYVFGALQNGMDLGKGNGPLNHGYALKAPCHGRD